MRLSKFLLINSVVGLVFGLGFVLGPAPLLSEYGVQTDAAGIVMSRFFGAALIQLGILLYIAHTTGDRVALRAMVVAGLVGSLAGLAELELDDPAVQKALDLFSRPLRPGDVLPFVTQKDRQRVIPKRRSKAKSSAKIASKKVGRKSRS
jgi:hypothetical protein